MTLFLLGKVLRVYQRGQRQEKESFSVAFTLIQAKEDDGLD